MTELTHYERIRPSFQKHRDQARRFVESLVQAKIPVWESLHRAAQQRNMVPDAGLAVMSETIRAILNKHPDPYSYGRLCGDDDFKRFASYLMGTSTPNAMEVMTILVTEFHLLCHERAGKRVYDVTPALAEKLDNTELRGLNTDDLKLPFESIYLATPAASGLRVWNRETGWHRCIGIYVTEDKHTPLYDVKVRSGIMAAGVQKDVVRSWRLLVCGEPKADDPRYVGIEGGNDALSFFHVFMPDGATLDEAIDLTSAEMKRDEEELKITWDQEKEWRRLFRWAMNAILYATWTEPGEHWIANKEARQLWERIQKLPKGSTKKGDLQRRLAGLDQRRRIVLGRNVRPTEAAPDIGTRGPIVVRTRVSGHWRNQPHGPGRELRKLIWIEPFWRGPDDGVVSEPVHVMK